MHMIIIIIMKSGGIKSLIIFNLINTNSEFGMET